jgi:CxxC-x17-CxxC domain-containing protein
MTRNDKKITCKDCGRTFIFRYDEQNYYAEQGYDEPIRCKDCRAAKKSAGAQRQEKPSGRFDGGTGFKGDRRTGGQSDQGRSYSDSRPPRDERPPRDGMPLKDGGRPPRDGSRPPRDGSRPPRDGSRPPRDGSRPPRDGSRPPRDGSRPPRDGARPPRDGRAAAAGPVSRGFERKESFPATCAACGKQTTVPFKPREGGKPVYCKDCFNKQR